MLYFLFALETYDHRKNTMQQTGTVIRFNKIKGYGFIQSEIDNQEIFVHFSEVQAAGYKELKVGQRISYTLKQGERGAFATHVQVTEAC